MVKNVHGNLNDGKELEGQIVVEGDLSECWNMVLSMEKR